MNSASPAPRSTGNAPSAPSIQASTGVQREDLLLGHVVHRPPGHRGDHERIQEAAVVGGDDHRPTLWDVLPADPAHPEVDVEESLEGHPDQPVDERIGPMLPSAPMERLRDPSHNGVPSAVPPVTVGWHEPQASTAPARSVAPSAAPSPPRCGHCSSRWTSSSSPAAMTTSSCSARRSLAAMAGTPIGLWDAHGQRRAVRRRLRQRRPGVLPIPPALRGPAAALAEHVALWPLGALTDQLHPARADMPEAQGQPRAPTCRRPGAICCSDSCWASSSAVSTPSPSRRRRSRETDFSSNGHGSLEHAVSVHESP